MIREITIDGQKVQYNLTYKPVKNINVRVKNNREVCVSANYRISVEYIDKMLADNSSFILSALSRATCGDSRNSYCDGATLYYLGEPMVLRVVQADGYSIHKYGTELIVSTRNTAVEIVEKQVKKWYDEKLRECFSQVEKEVKLKFSGYISFTPEFTYRYMKSIWGSCNKNRRKITINKNLIKYDRSLIEFVYCHEYSHLIYADHSKNFYALLTAVLPDHKQRKNQLKEAAAKY